MVHVSRTLRRLREGKVTLVDRQIVIILDVERLRAITVGLLPTGPAANWAEKMAAARVHADPTLV
jgi:hypothetical protein